MLSEKINSSLKEAMMKKDGFKTSVLRMMIAAIHNREIEKKGKGQELNDDDVMDVLRKEAKKRREASVMYEAGGRAKSAAEEEKEVQFIEGFLPAKMPEEEIEVIVSEVLKEFENPTQKDFGIIMKKVMEKISGRTDGSTVSAIIKKHLL
jgi:hypothetical protein